MQGKYLEHSEIRLVRYTRLIDQAIAQSRYGLATHLAYRCLVEYHRLCLRFLAPQAGVLRKNAFQLSVELIHFLRGTQIPFSFSRTRYLFTLLSASYQLTRWSRLPYGDKDMHIDLAMATYARDQSLALSRFLLGTLREYQPGQQ